jgi:DnaJ family protein C protein 9
MDLILDEIYSSDLLEDEPRFRSIIEAAIDAKEVESFKKFVKESKAKQSKRKAVYETEAKEAEVERVRLGIDESEESLKNAILNRRKEQSDGFLSKLEEKYAKIEKAEKRGGKKKVEEEADDDEENEDEPPPAKISKAPKRANSKKVKRL